MRLALSCGGWARLERSSPPGSCSSTPERPFSCRSSAHQCAIAQRYPCPNASLSSLKTYIDDTAAATQGIPRVYCHSNTSMTKVSHRSHWTLLVLLLVRPRHSGSESDTGQLDWAATELKCCADEFPSTAWTPHTVRQSTCGALSATVLNVPLATRPKRSSACRLLGDDST